MTQVAENQAPQVQGPAAPKTPDGVSARPATLSTADLVARCEPSVALIRGKQSLGTGFIVRPGLVATNAHVIDGEIMQNIEVRFPSAEEPLGKGP